MAQQTVELSGRRSALKAKLTKFKTFIEDDANKSKITEITLRLEKLDGILETFEELQQEIDSITNSSTSEYDDFADKYYTVISQARDLINVNNRGAATINETANVVNASDLSNIKLPKIELIKFDGSFDKWLSFRDSYTSMIHDNVKLSNIQRLHYLRSSLRGEALAVISALETSNENYVKAWKLINERYENKRLIIQKHIRTLMELPCMTKESAEQLRNLIDEIHVQLRSLDSLGEPTKEWSSLLLYLLTQKIDRSTHREWEKTVTGSTMPLFSTFMTFLEQRCQVLHSTSLNVKSIEKITDGQNKIKNQIGKKHAFHATRESKTDCNICNGTHRIYACAKFKELGIKERADKIKSLKLCFNCLNPGHVSSECKWAGCKKCGKKHNTLIHIEKNENEQQEDRPTIKTYSATSLDHVLLSTAIVEVMGYGGRLFKARALLDNGSQSHFMTEQFAKKLQLPTERIDLPIATLNEIKTRVKQTIATRIYSRHSTFYEELNFLIIPEISAQLPDSFIEREYVKIPEHIKLADSEFNIPQKIDLLIGAEIFLKLLRKDQVEIPGQLARLQDTDLGWIIAGRISKPKVKTCLMSLNVLQNTMHRFWEIEERDNATFLSEEQYEVEQYFKETTKRDPKSGRYEVRLPFNDKINKLGKSRDMATKQFFALERRLSRDTNLKEQYIRNMREALELGHMVPVKHREISDKHCFLPHHPVIKNTSSTTKLRIVYNASAKTSTGITLNECLKIGAVVQHSSFIIALRFRTYQVAMMADIEKMFKQIRLNEEDSRYQLLLWRENEKEDVGIYRVPVVLFGNAAAPYTATRVLNQLADDESTAFPRASEVLKYECYVDDIMTGADSVEEALRLRDDLINITRAGGFVLRKWSSNVSHVINELTESSPDINIITDGNTETKALGLQWERNEDAFKYYVTEENNKKYSKRKVLADIARLYDPLGLLGPIIIQAKMLMQELWQCSVGWDEEIPPATRKSWTVLREQLPEIKQIGFPRSVIIAAATEIQIHGFCDASEKAFGGCIYVRSTNKTGSIKTALLCSKNRVAPLKTISLPRLELCAALLLAQLIKTIIPIFLNKRVTRIILWSDSEITLHWIKTPPYLLKTFVANRVAEIQRLTTTMEWRHVPSQTNAADILSRGQLPKAFIQNETWRVGPAWLQKDYSNWPNQQIHLEILPETKTIKSFHSRKITDDLLHKYSSFQKLVRVMAYVYRFKNAPKSEIKITGELKMQELRDARTKIIKLVQGGYFINDIKQLKRGEAVSNQSPLRALAPFLDDQEVIRVGGRLINSDLNYTKKYPIVLPKSNHVTNLIIQEIHIINLHGATQATLSAVRDEYWPLNGKGTVKKVLRKCVTCFRAKPKLHTNLMADLPRDRVIATRPFSNSGMDFCGPFYIKEKKHRNRGKIKIYVCIFVCFSTKAVHIELVSDLTTEAFLGSMRRFFARRGYVNNLYCDNATNFVGAKNELQRFLASGECQKTFSQQLAYKNIQWHFSPPKAPHFGGLWEAAVKAFKYYFSRTIGDTLFTFEEVQTYAIEIEAILNSRPLTPLSNDPNDLRVLTPAHFLIGESLTSLPDNNYDVKTAKTLSAWKHIQYVKEQFWRRWRKEYLNQLMVRSKWQNKKPEEIKIGTMVLLKEDNVPTLRWPIGRIMKTIPGQDGIVRVVKVKTCSGTYKRPATSVAILPID